MRLNPVLADLGEYPLATIQMRARQRREAGLPTIDFSIGDPREPTPPFIPEALRAAVPEVSQYPTSAGLPELRGAVAAYVRRRFEVDVDPDTQVIPTSGAKEAIFSTPLAFVDRAGGDTVVYPSPGYPVYERGARFAGADTHPVALGGDFVFRVSDVPNAVWTSARLVWTCTPHNPSGAVTPVADLAAFHERTRDVEALLLSDECYADVYEEDAYPAGPASVLQVAGPDLEGVLAYLSLSKRSGMTGYRSAAIVGDAEGIAALRSLRSTTGTASPEFVQAAAVAAWGDDDHAAVRRRIFAEKRRVLRGAFDESGFVTIASRAGLYLWIAVEDDLAFTDLLLDHGIVVSPGRSFGRGGEGHIRLALVPTVEDCIEAAEVLSSVLA